MTFDSADPKTIYLEDLEVGMCRTLDKVITDHDIQLFAEVSTDHNPVHLNQAYAEKTMFKGRIAHGILTASLISAVIGEQLPGHGTVYLGQNLRFLVPVRPGQTVHTKVTVTSIDPEKHRVTLETLCLVGDTVVVKGDALVLAPCRNAAK